MKALEKERARRYETANGLAQDVRRYLAGEVVLAAPPGSAYRLRKFVRRHRLPVAAASAVAAALVAGLAGTAWQAKVASGRAHDLRKVSDFQQKMLAQVDPTTAGVRLTEDVTRRFAAALEKAKVPEAERTAQTEAFRRSWARVNARDTAAALIDVTILQPAVKAIEEQFRDQPAVDAQLRQALADRYRELGLHAAALPLQERALATRRRVLGEEHPDTLRSIASMAVLVDAQGKLAESEPYYREALEKRRRVLGEEHPDTLKSIASLGSLLEAQGKYAEAERYTREAMEKSRRVLGEEHPDTLHAIASMGSVLQAEGRYAEAEAYYREALEKRRRVLGEDHPDTLISLNHMGFLLHSQDRFAEAEAYFREALEKSRRVQGEQHPTTLIFAANLGRLLRLQGRYGEVIDLLAPAEPAARKAFTGGNARRLAGLLTTLAEARIGVGFDLARFGLAEANLLEAHPILVKTRGETHEYTLECVQGLADLYAAWEKAEPGKGYGARAAEWKAKLASALARTGKS